MKKLITMTEFVMWLYPGIRQGCNELENIHYYAKLLQTPLSLSQFIPCKDGEPIKEPEPQDYFSIYLPSDKFTEKDKKGFDEFSQKLMAWEDADKSVLFEGWSVTAYGCYHKESETNIHFYPEGIKLILSIKVPEDSITKAHTKDKWIDGIKTIEDLINSGIGLTPTSMCRKQIGLDASTEK